MQIHSTLHQTFFLLLLLQLNIELYKVNWKNPHHFFYQLPLSYYDI